MHFDICALEPPLNNLFATQISLSVAREPGQKPLTLFKSAFGILSTLHLKRLASVFSDKSLTPTSVPVQHGEQSTGISCYYLH